MNKEWFEPGADGVSRFEKIWNEEYGKPGALTGTAISAAFRALLAGEEQSVDTQRSIAAALANGQLSLQDEITGMRDEVERLTVELRACKDERMAAEIERDAADEFVKRLTAERDALQASLREEQAKRASIEAELAACRESRDAGQATVERLNEHNINLQADLSTAKRDIAAINSYWAEADAKAKELQARIDGGVRVWGDYLVWGQLEEHDTHTGIVIDVEKIRPDVVEMADERKGERRKVIPARIRRDGFDYSMDYDTPWMTNRRKYDRRRTAGTIADRRKK